MILFEVIYNLAVPLQVFSKKIVKIELPEVNVQQNIRTGPGNKCFFSNEMIFKKSPRGQAMIETTLTLA